MRTFGKVILGIIVIFLGITIFNYANSVGVHKAVAEQGDKAYTTNNIDFFKNRFEYHLDTPLLEEEVEFTITDEYLEEKGIDEAETKDVSFDLFLFHSANVTKDSGNYLTIFIKDLILPEGIQKEPYLEMFFEYSAYVPKTDESFNIVKIGDENWYLQWIKIALDNINSFTLVHDDLTLYQYDLQEPLLRAEDYDLISIVNKKDHIHGVVEKISDEEVSLDFLINRDYPVGVEVAYELDFMFRLNGNLDFKEDLYLSGEFNDWAIGDERYKLSKNRDDVYNTKISYSSEHEEVYFTITTIDGRAALDSEDNVKYYEYKFINQNAELIAYDIVKSYSVTFDHYNYYKWIAIGSYVGILVIAGVIVFVVTISSEKKKQKRRSKNVYNEPKPGSQSAGDKNDNKQKTDSNLLNDKKETKEE